MKWNICYPGFMVHDGTAFEEWGTAVSQACSRVAGENADIFFFPLSYRVVRNASNKY